jgi:MoaA/NifB/PqqE/SkfB family radical SAM enzyme
MSVDGPYSPLKVFHHQDRIAKLRRGDPIVPAQVQLFISDVCGMRCNFCAFRLEGYESNQLFSEIRPDGTVNNNPNRQIEFGKVIEILDDCKDMGVKAIQWTGGGEPTAHAAHCEIFAAALKRNLEIALVTNGSKLTPELCKTLCRPGSKWVRISVDSGTPETYSSVRGVSQDAYHRMLEGVKRLVASKRFPSPPHSDPVIGIGFVVTQDNWREVVDATETAKALGVDNIRISAVFQPDDEEYFADFYEEAAALCRAAKQLETPAFRVFNLFGERLDDLRQRSPSHSFCGYQHFNTLIGADLNVYRCCVTAYHERGLIGSIKNRRFRELWFSEATQERLWDFDARRCPRCMFHGRLDAINYAIGSDPEHINFV